MKASLSFFITGTDTEIGKTLVTSALLHALATKGWRAAGMKPVAAGAVFRNGSWHNEDADMLMAAANVKLPQEMTTPFLLREPASPHIAAELEQAVIDIDHICRCYDQVALQSEAVIVEGVGGFCVPLTERISTADLSQKLGLPVIMVVGLRLGCINHALLTAEAIEGRGLKLVGWVANRVDPNMAHVEANVATLQARLPAPLLGVVPRLAHPTAAAAAEYIDFSCLPGWFGKHAD